MAFLNFVLSSFIIICHIISCLSCATKMSGLFGYGHGNSSIVNGSDIQREGNGSDIHGEVENGLKFSKRNYYISMNPATNFNNASSISNADEDCRRIGGNHFELLWIETEAEFIFLRNLMTDFGSGKAYWTSGRYDGHKKLWVWGQRGLPILPFALPSLPNNYIPTIHDKLVFRPVNRFTASFGIASDSQPQRYICKAKPSTYGIRRRV